jgi:histidinol-phosphatase
VSNDLQPDLNLALQLADIADSMTLPKFNAQAFVVEWKDNLTEVTEVDRNVETELLSVIRAQRPHHNWYGEEHGTGGSSDGQWTWVIDPIDGTSNFVRGVPVWATLIALVNRDVGPVLGVVSAPALHTRWWGVIDGGAFRNGVPITVSKVSELLDAHASITANTAWNSAGKSQNIHRLHNTVRRARGFGDFWQHMLVAEGSIDLAVDAIGLEPYDIAALIPIVEAAGGVLTERDGSRTWQGSCAISSNGVLHHDIIAILNA